MDEGLPLSAARCNSVSPCLQAGVNYWQTACSHRLELDSHSAADGWAECKRYQATALIAKDAKGARDICIQPGASSSWTAKRTRRAGGAPGRGAATAPELAAADPPPCGYPADCWRSRCSRPSGSGVNGRQGKLADVCEEGAPAAAAAAAALHRSHPLSRQAALHLIALLVLLRCW